MRVLPAEEVARQSIGRSQNICPDDISGSDST